MKTLSINVYEYAELSLAAQRRARDWYIAGYEFPWANEYLASIKALAEKFDGEVKTWSVDWGDCNYSSMEFSMPGMWREEDIAGVLASLGSFNVETMRGNGDCKLTGWAMDEGAIDGFRAAFFKARGTNNGELDLELLMQAAFKSWLKEAQADYAYELTDEAIASACEANNYTFTLEGKRFG